VREGSFLAYLDSCCPARAHNRSGSRSPCFANSIITLATASRSERSPALGRGSVGDQQQNVSSMRPFSDGLRVNCA
jgi:hypothetical protein